MLDLSPTMKVYFPCLSVVTFLPFAFLSEIVKPGPIVPRSFGAAIVVAVVPVAIPTATSAAADERATRRKRMLPLLPCRGLQASIGRHSRTRTPRAIPMQDLASE